MWSVFTGPYLVETVVPSISGSRSRCTPSRLGPRAVAFAVRDLVDLVDEDDAVVLDEVDRLAGQLVLVEQLVGFLGEQRRVRVLDLDLALDAAAAEAPCRSCPGC